MRPRSPAVQESGERGRPTGSGGGRSGSRGRTQDGVSSVTAAEEGQPERGGRLLDRRRTGRR